MTVPYLTVFRPYRDRDRTLKRDRGCYRYCDRYRYRIRHKNNSFGYGYGHGHVLEYGHGTTRYGTVILTGDSL